MSAYSDLKTSLNVETGMIFPHGLGVASGEFRTKISRSGNRPASDLLQTQSSNAASKHAEIAGCQVFHFTRAAVATRQDRAPATTASRAKPPVRSRSGKFRERRQPGQRGKPLVGRMRESGAMVRKFLRQGRERAGTAGTSLFLCRVLP